MPYSIFTLLFFVSILIYWTESWVDLVIIKGQIEEKLERSQHRPKNNIINKNKTFGCRSKATLSSGIVLTVLFLCYT